MKQPCTRRGERQQRQPEAEQRADCARFRDVLSEIEYLIVDNQHQQTERQAIRPVAAAPAQRQRDPEQGKKEHGQHTCHPAMEFGHHVRPAHAGRRLEPSLPQLRQREYTLTELWQRRFEPPPGVRRSDMVAEFHSRVTRVLSVLFLPLLGIPLALGRRRSDRPYGLALGLLVLIIYNQALDLGKNIAETGAISPLLGLWLPLLAFASASTWLFHRAS